MLKYGTDVPLIDLERSKFMKVRENQRTGAFRGIKIEKQVEGAAWQVFERQRSWDMELSETADVRADVVARGKALVANPTYPSRQQLHSVARLLAGRLRKNHGFFRQNEPFSRKRMAPAQAGTNLPFNGRKGVRRPSTPL
jgi:hypothetical protein